MLAGKTIKMAIYRGCSHTVVLYPDTKTRNFAACLLVAEKRFCFLSDGHLRRI